MSDRALLTSQSLTSLTIPLPKGTTKKKSTRHKKERDHHENSEQMSSYKIINLLQGTKKGVRTSILYVYTRTRFYQTISDTEVKSTNKKLNEINKGCLTSYLFKKF